MNISAVMATRDFPASTIRKLAAKGVTLLSPCLIPHPKTGFINPDRGYNVDDNGTGKTWSYAQVLRAGR